MATEWESIVRNLGLKGLDWCFPPEAAKNASKVGVKSPLELFIEKLRSGESMPASAASELADILEGKWLYKFELVPVKTNLRNAEYGAQSIGIGLEIERIVRDNSETVSDAVASLAEYLKIDERTIWRHWKNYRNLYPSEFFPNGYLPEFEKANRDSQLQLGKLLESIQQDKPPADKK